MIGSYIDNPNVNYLSVSQMKNMSDSGIISFQSHTYNHIDLRRTDVDEGLGIRHQHKKYFR